MDPFSALGAEASGSRLAEQDVITNQFKGLQAQQLMGQIARQPAQLQLDKEHARLFKARADQEEIENDAMRRLQASMQGGGELPDDPLEAMYDIAKRASRAGATKEATTTLQRAGLLVKQRADAERAYAAAEKANIEGKVKQRDTFAGMLGTVTNQASLDAANQLYEQMFQEPSPMRGKAYDANEVRRWQDSTLNAKDRLNAELRRNEESGRNRGRSITDRHNKEEERLRQEEIDRKKEADKLREKNGGRGVGKPSREDTAAAGRLLKDFQPALDSDGSKIASDTIASRAMEIIRGNRAIGRNRAIQMAYDEELKAGSFETGPRVDLPIVGGVGTKTTFARGRNPRQPLHIPAGEEGTIARQLKKGSYYTTARGVAKWNGKEFEEVDALDEDE